MAQASETVEAVEMPTTRAATNHRILQVIDTLDPGGAERILVNLSNALTAGGHKVVVCCTRRSGPLAADLSPSVEVHVLGRRRRWDLSAVRQLARLVTDSRIELVHSHLRHTMQFVALSKATRVVTVPHVFHDHNGLVHIDDSVPRHLRVAVRFGVDAYIGVDRALCRWACTNLTLSSDRVFLLRNTIDPSRFATSDHLARRDDLGLANCDFLFVMLANLRTQKDHPNLLRALALLPRSPSIGVVVAGMIDAEPGLYEDCLALARALGVDGRIHFLGPRSDVPALLMSCDGGVLSSVSESGPLAVLEYMAAGRPYVVTDVGELTRQVTKFDAGLLVAPRDPAALADAMLKLARLSGEERSAMGSRGRRGAAEFGHVAQLGELISIYEPLLP